MRDRIRKENKKRFLILGILLLTITIGYAALGTTLNINGTTGISNATWDIHWNNVQVKSGSVSIGTGDQAATITQGNNQEVTYAVTLSTPGDFYEFTVDAVNAGSIDGMIDTITSTYKIGNGAVTPITSNNLPAYLNYSVTYSDGVAIAQNQELKSGDTETYKVRVEFKKDIENNQLPGSAQTITFNFGVNYVQANSNATPVSHDNGVYTVNTSSIEGYVEIGQAIPNGITTYQTPAAAMAAYSNRPFYLKHTISNDIVTESYVGFVVTEAMAQENPGMTAGTYYLRGGAGSESSLTDKPIYEANKATLLTAFGSSNCINGSSDFYCYVPGLNSRTTSSGYVDADIGNWLCSVSLDGYAACEGY